MGKKKQKAASDNSCLADSCFYIDIGGCFDFGDGCANNDGGCVDFDAGCFNIFDGCSLSFGGVLRAVVILGLILYGDWDFKNRCAKLPD